MARGWGRSAEARIERLLDQAAQDRRAAVAPDRTTRDALERRVAKGTVTSPLPGLYVATNDWENLQEDVALRTTVLARGGARRGSAGRSASVSRC